LAEDQKDSILRPGEGTWH